LTSSHDRDIRSGQPQTSHFSLRIRIVAAVGCPHPQLQRSRAMTPPNDRLALVTFDAPDHEQR
jgi:hypothetical protein